MDDFERRREMRRQKREEMRQEVERVTYERNDDDEEEAARERRRRARQERQRLNRDDADGHDGTQNSIAGEETKSSSVTNTDLSADDESALLERLAKREERRQKRLQEALDRQKELDPTISINETISITKSTRNGENEVQENDTSPKENNTEVYRGQHEVEETERVDKSFKMNDRKEEVVEHVETEEVEVKQDVQEETPEEPHIEENQVEVTFQIENIEMSRVGVDGEVTIEAVVTRDESEDEQTEAEEIRKSAEEALEKERKQEAAERERVEAEKRAAEERMRLEEEAEEREGIEAKRKEAEERDRLEEEARQEAAERERERAERKAAEENERLEAEEREQKRRKEEEERKAAEERLKAEQRRAEEERKKLEAEEKRKAEEKKAAEEREKRKAEEKRVAEEKARLEAKKKEEKLKAEEKKDVKVDDKQVKGKKLDDKIQPAFLRKQGEDKENKFEAKKDDKGRPGFKKEEIKDEKTFKDKGGKEELKASWERKTKTQNGESLHEVTPQKLKHMDKFGGAKGQPSSDETDRGTKMEAGKKLEELKRRKGDSETGDFEKLKQKQQEAAVELDELKKKREERRKMMEEEDQRKKQEETERKAKEEEEKKKLKEEIERRRAEAAEKRQKLADDGLTEEKKPFKCFTPKGSSFKIEERAEFLNKSSQKSVKAAQPAVVSKIDSRLEQYTSAIGSNKGPKPAKPAPADLPLVTEGVRNIKSMWEKGNAFSSPSGIVSPNKETAGLKVGVSSRINEWLTKTPETNKTPATKPSDLRPGDVSGKRNMWEKQPTEKPGSPTKMTTGGKKSDTNGLRFEKEP